MRTGKIYCPVNGWDCPYYKNGECGIENPLSDCDDFACFWDEDDDFICEDEKNGEKDRLFHCRARRTSRGGCRSLLLRLQRHRGKAARAL